MFRIPFAVSSAKNLVMAAKHASGLKPVPGVVKLDIMVTAATRQSVLPTAVADIPPSVRNAQNGYLKGRFKASKQKEVFLTSKRVRLSLQNPRAGHYLLVAALLLLLLAPRMCQHGHLLVQLLSRLISHGLIDRNNPH